MKRSDYKVIPLLGELRRLFVYDPVTGVLVWRVQPHLNSSKARAGSVAGCFHKRTGYLRVVIDQKQYYVHRIIWKMQVGSDPVYQIDHIDGVRSNNKWSNLRSADNCENSRNSAIARNNTSGVKGVSPERGNAWVVHIKAGGRPIRIGRFKNFEDAVAARRDAESRLHGEFARTV